MVHPRNPVQKDGPRDHSAGPLSLKISGLDELSDIISDLQHDAKGLPALFRKYPELGGRLLAFSLDPQFNNTLDGFIFIDLTEANRRLLEFYMGRDCSAQYLTIWRWQDFVAA